MTAPAAWVEVPTNTGAVVLVDIEDYERLAGRRVSIGSHGYAQVWDRPGMMLLHRWIMQVPVGVGYRLIVDHINRDRLDCRRQNLRIVTASESNLNRQLRPRALPRGVTARPSGRYEARIKRNSQSRYLGLYDTPAEAALAVRRAREVFDRPEFLDPPAAA
jgi:hypothetical protein